MKVSKMILSENGEGKYPRFSNEQEKYRAAFIVATDHARLSLPQPMPPDDPASIEGAADGLRLFAEATAPLRNGELSEREIDDLMWTICDRWEHELIYGGGFIESPTAKKGGAK